MYIPKHFIIQELLPMAFFKEYESYGERLWYLFDDRVLWTADQLREIYGGMIVNTWHKGGKIQFRGWRPWDCKTGALMSQHKFGRALDLMPMKPTAKIIRRDILADPTRPEFKYITCIEEGTSWLHFDVRNFDRVNRGILVVNG